MINQASRRGRLSKVHRVTPSGHEGGRAIGQDTSQVQGMRAKSGVVGSGQGQDRGGDAGQFIPQGSLGPGARQSQARCQPSSTITQPLLALRRSPQASEHWSADPTVDERLDIGGRRRLQLCRSRFVTLPSLLTNVGIGNATCRSDYHHSPHGQRVLKCHMQGHSRPQRVAEQVARIGTDSRNDTVGDEFGGGREIRSYRIGASVSGQVNADKREMLRKRFSEGTPQATRLSEPVQKDQGRTRSTHFEVKRHDR